MLNYEDGELDQSSIVPLVDGGTEGFKGNARVILPGISACIECTLDLYPPQVIVDSLKMCFKFRADLKRTWSVNEFKKASFYKMFLIMDTVICFKFTSQLRAVKP